jgi:O-succinylbenzoate synthase
MRYRFEFRPYRRRFVRSLATSHGTWDIRDGIILRLTDETGIGWGEIAPISWFGSETIEQALLFCHQLPTEITEETIFSIPDELPACQFGFESALRGLGSGEMGRQGDKGTRGQFFSIPIPPLLLSPTPSPTVGYYLLVRLLWNNGRSYGNRDIARLSGKLVCMRSPVN